MLAFLKNLFQPKQANAAMAWGSIQKKAGNQVGGSYWLYATPVHLVLQRDTFSLAAPVPLSLDTDEVDALTAVLNQHFASDGLAFIWYKNTWFLSLQTDPQISTAAPQAAINKDISAYLPTGEGATKWASFQNELQMLLFEHPVNLARETKRLPVINSIWCYGLGQIKNHAN